jgi:hypothetical protein
MDRTVSRVGNWTCAESVVTRVSNLFNRQNPALNCRRFPMESFNQTKVSKSIHNT